MAHVRWNILRYQTVTGRIPFDEFMESLTDKEKARVIRTVELLETFGTALHEPYIKHLTGTELWEMRIDSGSNAFRVFYFTWTDYSFVLLNGFKKKGQKTPRAEMERAEQYLRDFKERSS
jgi:phage-related protein